MGSPDQTKDFRFSGKLIKTPTDLSASPAYGGTILGAISRAQLQYARPKHRVPYEEFRETGEMITGGPRVIFRCQGRQFDKDMTLAAFPTEATTDADGKPLITIPSTLRAGATASGSGIKLLFAADDPTNKPSALIYLAIPEVITDIDLSGVAEAMVYMEWEGIRDGSARMAQWGYLARLSL